MVTSFKGGVGKTTVSANLSMALARRGNRVVAVDCDLESRCLDIVLGLEDASLYNVSDVLSGRCSPSEAIVNDRRCDKLKFIPAPAYYDFLDETGSSSKVSLDAVRSFIDELCMTFDYVILDCPVARTTCTRSCEGRYPWRWSFHSTQRRQSVRRRKPAMMLFDMSDERLGLYLR